MNISTAPDGTIRAALRYPAFRLLIAGLAVSLAGDWLYNLALVALVYERTGSGLWAGATAAARVLPMVVLGPFGGVVADRFDRRRVMVVCDLIRLVLMLALALVAAARLPVILAPVLAALATAATAPYLPAVAATTPKLVSGNDLPGANAARSAVTALGIIAGPAIGGVLLLLGSPAIAFVVNSATFGVSAVAVLAIRAADAFRVGNRSPKTENAGIESPETGTEEAKVNRPGPLRGIADGAAALRAHPRALWQVGADFTCSLVYGMQTVLLIGVAQRAGLGLHGYGYLFAALGVGGVAGTSLTARVLRIPRPRAILLGALAVVGLPMMLLAVVPSAPAALLLTALTGVGAIIVEVTTETVLQRMLPDEVFGRAYGLAIPAAVAGIAIGAIAAPVVASVFGTAGALVVCGGLVMGYAAALLLAPTAATAATPGATTAEDQAAAVTAVPPASPVTAAH